MTAAADLMLLDALFASAPVGLGLVDADLRFRRVNAALAAMNGRSIAEHVGRTPEEVVGATGEGSMALLREVQSTGEAVTGAEIVGVTPAAPGVRRTWLVSFYPVAEQGAAVLVLEVTDERAAADQARQARRGEQRASALVDAVFAAAPVGLVAFDADLRYRRVNPALAALNGRLADELVGRRPGEAQGELGARLERVLEEVLQTGRPAIEVQYSGRLPGHDETQYRSASYFPVLTPDGVAGIGGVVRDVGPQRATEDLRDRLLRESLTTRAQAEAQELRAQIARADTEAALRRTEFLARATERLNSSMELDVTLHELTQIAVPALADMCAVALVEPGGRLEVVADASANRGRGGQARRLLRAHPPRVDDAHLFGRAVRTGETEVVTRIGPEHLDALARDDEHREALEAVGARSALTVPLLASGRPIGAVTLITRDSAREFGPDDVTLAEALAARAALALDNARLYTERSRIARTLQSALLPAALPAVPGVELAVRYRAAGAENEVGGDFYDVLAAGDGAWTAVVGDVAGKGAEAAALTALSRHTLRAAALRDSDPVAQLALLNHALAAHQGDQGGFCTVLLARLCPGDGGVRLTLATGGHLPPYLLRADGRVECLELRGALVGALAEPAFGVLDRHLAPGDRLVLYTDGVTELRGEDPREGERALDALLRENALAAPEALVVAVEGLAVERQAGEPRDDIAVMAFGAL